MIGMVYKDIRINRKWLGLAIAVLFFLNLLTALMILGDDDAGFQNMGLLFKGFFMMMTGASFMITGAFSLNFVESDERRKWGYYVTSLPRGIAKQVTAKYVFIALTLLLTYGLCTGVNFVLRQIDDRVPNVNGILLIMVCISLIMRAIELPCIIAFGTKIGSQVKGGLILLLLFIVIIYALFGDLSWLGTEEEFWESFFSWIGSLDLAKLLKGWSGKLLIGGIPMYIISCFISTKLYLKGVDRMEK